MSAARAAVVLLAVAAATPQAQYFRYQRPLTVPPPTAQSPQTCTKLDAALFAHAAPQLADLRLYRGGQETPYVVRQSLQDEERRQTIAALNLGSRDGRTSFDAAMPDGTFDDVSLNVSGENFIASVSVTGSQDQKGTATKLGAFTIFDLTDQKLGRSTVLHLPESDFRYLHFSVAGPIRPEQIGGLAIEQLPAKEQSWTVVAESTETTQKGHDTVVQFNVPAHVPVERVVFAVGDTPKNFSRDVTVKALAVPVTGPRTDEELPQSSILAGNLLRVHGIHDGHQIDEERLAVDAPWSGFGDASTAWTVTIDNGDDPPLAVNSVRLEMAERQLCFDATAGANYTLFYGDAALAAPRYDYATLFAAEKNPNVAALGPEELNPDYRPRPDERPFTERHPGLLWAALIVVVVVLGAVALRTAKSATAPTP